MPPDAHPPLAPMALCITAADVLVWFGSLAAAARTNRDVRFTPEIAELVRLSRTSIVDEMREEHRRRVLGD
jgi:hypothetical protein